jgi:hypothetical protein
MADWWAISVDNFCIGIVDLVQVSACDRGESNLDRHMGIITIPKQTDVVGNESGANRFDRSCVPESSSWSL